MILVRDVFRLQFGRAREAIAVWQEGRGLAQKAGFKSARLLTDLVGPYYTLVLETTFDSLADYERAGQALRDDEKWRAWYAKVPPLSRDGYREIFTIVE
jgi:hypothetical protein